MTGAPTEPERPVPTGPASEFAGAPAADPAADPGADSGADWAADHAADRSLSSPDERFGARLRRRSSASILLERLLEQETANLAATADVLRADGSLERAAQRIVGARRRFVLGGSKSAAYAALLAADLSASLANVALIDGTTTRPVDVLCDVRSSDVLVAYSLRRYTRTSVAIAREFAAAGGVVVGITDDAESSLARVADETVVVTTHSASYADSPTAVAATTHILATLTAASAKGARRRLQQREAVTQRLEIYEEP